jgi:hypothetical protein
MIAQGKLKTRVICLGLTVLPRYENSTGLLLQSIGNLALNTPRRAWLGCHLEFDLANIKDRQSPSLYLEDVKVYWYEVRCTCRWRSERHGGDSTFRPCFHFLGHRFRSDNINVLRCLYYQFIASESTYRSVSLRRGEYISRGVGDRWWVDSCDWVH